jgi:predicted glycosyltransferase
MKLLFDVVHPVAVHYFKGIILQLKAAGHEVLITARDKDITQHLLRVYNLPFINMGKMEKSSWRKISFLLKGEFKALFILLKHRPDMIVSMGSINLAHANFFTRIPFIVIDDTEHVALNRRLYMPFTHRIFTPKSFTVELGKKQYKLDGVLELFHLHPNQFPKWRIPIDDEKFSEKFAIIRFISWDAFHDIGVKKKNFNKVELIRKVEKYMNVFVSVEDNILTEFNSYLLKVPVEHFHSYIEKAAIYIGEGASTASESAILGTPAVYTNPLPLGYIDSHEEAGLLWNLGQSDQLIEKVEEILKKKDLKEETVARKNKLVSGMIDPTAFFLWYITNYPQSEETLRDDPDYQYQYRFV